MRRKKVSTTAEGKKKQGVSKRGKGVSQSLREGRGKLCRQERKGRRPAVGGRGGGRATYLDELQSGN